MSWDDYVSKQLVGTNCVTRGAIAGLDGSIWAKTPGWDITAADCKAFATGFTNQNSLVEKGIFCAGEKYFFLSGSQTILRGKKGNKGIHVSKTTTAMIIGQYDDHIQPGQCASTVETLSDYLSSCGY